MSQKPKLFTHETSMNKEVHLIGFAAWLAKKDSDNLTCEFHTTFKNQLLSYEKNPFIIVLVFKHFS